MLSILQLKKTIQTGSNFRLSNKISPKEKKFQHRADINLSRTVLSVKGKSCKN